MRYNIYNKNLVVLGIETTCDETAASVILLSADGKPTLLSNIIHSQISEHKKFGGVVPEIAARSHLDNIDFIVKKALDKAKKKPSEIDAVATSCGPGLIGGLIVGSCYGKAFAIGRKIPFIPVNHLEAHILSPRLLEKIEFPYLVLLISGGHTQLLYIERIGKVKRLGTTLDDSVGETFDKGAVILKLGWPGGKAIEKIASKGDPKAYKLPRPMIGREGADFSFSGLKTALYRMVDLDNLNDIKKANYAASLQLAITDVIQDRSENAMELAKKTNGGVNKFVVAGGVAANKSIRLTLEKTALKKNFSLFAPPISLCTDNAAMIAWAGIEHILRYGINNVDNKSFLPRPRWPLDPNAKAVGLAKYAR